MRHPDHERLTLVALGEQPVVDELASHLDGCERCRAEVTAMRDTVALAREAGSAPMEPPPEHVWSGIAAELALGSGPRATAADRARRSRPRRRVVVAALAAAVALIAAAAIAIFGGLAGGPDDTGAGRVVASASLTAYPGAPPGATGQVSVLDGVDGRRIEVTATMPPAPDRGYYEVWLLDARTNHMIAIGALAENGHGTYTMPTDLDMTSYATVDVSAEQYDGDPAHSTSILRGDLTP